MMLSELRLELSILESEDSKKIDDLVVDEAGYSEKDRNLFMQLFIDDKPCSSSAEHVLKTGGIPAYIEGFFFKALYPNVDHQFNIDKEESYFYPINCSCGIPECAGLEEAVRVELGVDTIEWFIDDKKTSKIFGSNYFIFDRKQFELELNKIQKFMEDNKSIYIYQDQEPILIGELLELWLKHLEKIKSA